MELLERYLCVAETERPGRRNGNLRFYLDYLGLPGDERFDVLVAGRVGAAPAAEAPQPWWRRFGS
jgi:hypothetical protein